VHEPPQIFAQPNLGVCQQEEDCIGRVELVAVAHNFISASHAASLIPPRRLLATPSSRLLPCLCESLVRKVRYVSHASGHKKLSKRGAANYYSPLACILIRRLEYIQVK
jgi:hypothetical protein